jgi:hypothetical protein
LDIEFVTAELSGPVGVDDFHIGPFRVKHQKFGMIEEEKGTTFAENNIEGIVGLGFPSLADTAGSAFFDTVIEQKTLKQNLFSVYMTQDDGATTASLMKSVSTEADVGQGAIMWGGYDTNLFEGDLQWYPVSDAMYWAVDFDGFYLGNKKMVVKESSFLSGSAAHRSGAYGRIIFDTGTTLYAADQDLLNTLQEELPPASCEEVTKYPKMTVKFTGAGGEKSDLVLGPEDYMVQTSSGDCHLGFMHSPPTPGYGPSMTFGELFIEKYFTVFDRGDGSDMGAKVGFARAKSGQLGSLRSFM